MLVPRLLQPRRRTAAGADAASMLRLVPSVGRRLARFAFDRRLVGFRPRILYFLINDVAQEDEGLLLVLVHDDLRKLLNVIGAQCDDRILKLSQHNDHLPDPGFGTHNHAWLILFDEPDLPPFVVPVLCQSYSLYCLWGRWLMVDRAVGPHCVVMLSPSFR